jgi:hypothetical protein
MQFGLSPEHPDYTWDRTSPLWVLPAVVDLKTPFANRRRNRRTISWSSHHGSDGRLDSCGLYPHALASGFAKLSIQIGEVTRSTVLDMVSIPLLVTPL